MRRLLNGADRIADVSIRLLLLLLGWCLKGGGLGELCVMVVNYIYI